jgi:hypothetical protein
VVATVEYLRVPLLKRHYRSPCWVLFTLRDALDLQVTSVVAACCSVDATGLRNPRKIRRNLDVHRAALANPCRPRSSWLLCAAGTRPRWTVRTPR